MLRNRLIVCFILAALFSATLPAFAQEATLTPPPTNEPTFTVTVEPAAPVAESTETVSDNGGVVIINNPQPPSSNTDDTSGGGNILSNILSGLVGGVIGLIAGLAGAIGMARSLKSDTNALTIMERVITAIAVATNKPELIPSVNKFGQGLQDVGEVLQEVTDNKPNDPLPPVSAQSRIYRPPTPPTD